MNSHPSSLQQKTVSGVKWNFASQAGQQLTLLLTTVLLARLLTPADFGMVGMAMVVIGFVSLFKDLGTSAAVIQKRDSTEELLSSVFWANAAFGALSTVVLVAAAPLVAMYYHEPRLTPVLRVLALNFVISGCSILQQALFQRELLFLILAKVEVAGVASGALVGIGFAVAGAGVWALVAQSVTTISVTTVLLWAFSNWRPRLLFHWGEIRRVGSYSLNLSGFNTFNYFARNMDYLLIGRYLGAAPLGIYTLAYRIMLYPQVITWVFSRVMFPVYSQLQDDDARFRSAYLRTAGLIAVVTFPMMAGVYVVAKPFVLLVFGPKWLASVPLIKILAIVGMEQSVGATVGSIYQAKGRTDVMFGWGACASSLTVIGFLVGLHWGVVGVAAAYALVATILLVPTFVIPFRFIGLKLPLLAAAVARPFAASVLMALAVYGTGAALRGIQQVPSLIALVVSGIVAYIVISWVLNRRQVCDVLALIAKRASAA